VLVDSRAIEASRIRRFVDPVEGVLEVTEVRSRGDLGTEAFTELTVIVDGEVSVEKGHEIADEVERKLLDAGFTRAVVHVEPPGMEEESRTSDGGG
jgi:divalent metal cation (Fe/Co/Zn/Cd) transporter